MLERQRIATRTNEESLSIPCAERLANRMLCLHYQLFTSKNRRDIGPLTTKWIDVCMSNRIN